MEEIKTKVCVHCGKEKTASDFSKSTSSEDGLQSWCNECAAEYGRKRTLYKEEGVKVCRKCGQILPKSKFGYREDTRDHHDTICKECRGIVEKEIQEAANEEAIPEIAAPATTPPDCNISDIPTLEIFAELQRRGFTGKLIQEFSI